MRERAWRAGRACGRRSRRPSGRSPRSRARESAGRRPSVSPLRTHSDVSHRAGSLVKNSRFLSSLLLYIWKLASSVEILDGQPFSHRSAGRLSGVPGFGRDQPLTLAQVPPTRCAGSLLPGFPLALSRSARPGVAPFGFMVWRVR